MPTTFDKILGKPLLHSHQASDITGMSGSDTVLIVNSDQILTSSSANVLMVDATNANISITLPEKSTVAGMTFKIKKTDMTNNIVSVIPNGTDKIENLSENLVIEFTNTAVQLMSTTGGWFII